MNSLPEHSDPEEFSDAEMYAYVEGELSESRTARIDRRLENSPEILGRVHAVRQDRLDLMNVFLRLGDEVAPAGVADRAIELAERAALLAADEERDGDEFARLPRAPAAMPRVGRSLHAWIPRMLVGRPVLAAAAALVLLVGGVVMVRSIGGVGAGHSTRIAKVARAPDQPEHRAGANDRDAAIKPSAPIAAADSALESGRVGAKEASSTGAVATTAAGATLPSIGPRVASEATGENEPPTMTMDRAAELAAAHRLAIRVVPRGRADAAKLATAMSALSTRDGGRGWKLDSRVPASTTSAVLARVVPRPADVESRARRETQKQVDHALAADHSSPVVRAPVASSSTDDSTGGGTPRVFSVEVASSAAALTGVRNALAGAGDVEVVFEELAEPIESVPSLSEQNLMWWSNPTSSWARRSAVPIVVEAMQ